MYSRQVGRPIATVCNCCAIAAPSMRIINYNGYYNTSVDCKTVRRNYARIVRTVCVCCAYNRVSVSAASASAAVATLSAAKLSGH